MGKYYFIAVLDRFVQGIYEVKVFNLMSCHKHKCRDGHRYTDTHSLHLYRLWLKYKRKAHFKTFMCPECPFLKNHIISWIFYTFCMPNNWNPQKFSLIFPHFRKKSETNSEFLCPFSILQCFFLHAYRKRTHSPISILRCTLESSNNHAHTWSHVNRAIYVTTLTPLNNSINVTNHEIQQQQRGKKTNFRTIAWSIERRQSIVGSK